MAKRLLLMVVAAGLALLVGEGALSLFLGRSVLDGLRETAPVELRGQHDEERFAAAARNPGPYRVHPDPMVGYVLKADAGFEFARAPVQSDTLGLRRRPGPTADDAFRIVVAGDSVAFGQGVANDQTLAHQLEVVLNRVRGPDLPPVECRTAALPGWNYRNAIHFVVDHLDQLDPDLVLFLPVDNDLHDTDGAFETGHRRDQPDPAAADPWLGVRASFQYLFALKARRQAEGTPLDPALAGPEVVLAGLSSESQRRLEDLTRKVGWLGERLATRESPLVLVGHVKNRLYLELRARGEDRWHAFPLLDRMTPKDTLGHDPHPNAETIRAFAIWTAGELLERGLVEGGRATDLPAPPARLQDRRAGTWPLERCRQELERRRAEELASLRATISHRTGEGTRQIFGGINGNGTIAHRLLALLGPGGDVLRVELAGLPGRPDLSPVPVTVEVAGSVVGELEVKGAGPVVGEFAIPAPADRPVEVRLIPGHWGVVTIRGTSRVASVQFLTLERTGDR